MNITVPHLAEGVTSGTVVSILVKLGEEIKLGQDIVELETSKAVAGVPATAAGKVAKIHIADGDEVQIGQVLISVEGGGEEPAAASPAQPEARTAGSPQPSARTAPAPAAAGTYEYQSSTGAAPPASPSVRKLSRELGIDLTRVRGSQLGGRITLADVRDYIQHLQGTVQTGVVQAAPKPAVSVDFAKWGPVERVKMSPLRKKIGEKMSQSWSSVVHVTQFHDVHVGALMALTKKHAADFEKKGARLTLTPLILKALVETLQEHPIFNASIDEAAGEIVYKKHYHLGIAVDTEQGLIVPVIRDVDKKDLLALALELQELAKKTRERKVSLEQLQGATFTVSNQGGIGGGYFTPIVNSPEVAILGLGRASLKAVVKDGKIASGMVLPVVLSYDHRVIDGGNAARFITDLAKKLEGFKFSEKKSKRKKK
ncbi:MAG: dihydrolipoamide acetyltransferase family protein [Candidatus Omnitrophota bacterium]|nr:dihydrolipoamide acetyltransferase family protein [Candidatus Omnitrophota bacterium]